MKSLLLNNDTIQLLPTSPGTYLFRKKNKILYIGKAISIKARILSHFENAKLDRREALITRGSDKISYILTDSEFKALLLESQLIKKYHPVYNLRWKDDKSYIYIKITISDKFPKVFTVRKENDGQSTYFGPFSSEKDVEVIIKMVRKIFPFCRQKKISKQACFYAKIGLCDPCPNVISSMPDGPKKIKLTKIYQKNIKTVIRILKGKIELALKDSYKLLKMLINEQKYEEAIIMRDKINNFERLISQAKFTFDHLSNVNNSKQSRQKLKQMLSVYFGNLGNLNRIECFDVSSLFFKQATASMVVFSRGLPDRSQYRRFMIKSRKIKSDLDMLEEIFKRRFRKRWPRPNLIIVDGGAPQVIKINQVLKILKIYLPLVGIAKHPDRLVIQASNKLFTLRPSLNNLGFILTRHLRDEAHRFARKYHLVLRRRKMMI